MHLLNACYLLIVTYLSVKITFQDSVSTRPGDMEKSVNQVFETLQSVLSSADGVCKFVCANGAKPRPNLHYVPSSNGCGAMGIQLDTLGMPEITRCCNAHDLCYDTCNKDRNECDTQFKECLSIVCNTRSKPLPAEYRKGCNKVTDMIYKGVVALGCKAYKDAQAKACLCRNTHRHENPIYNDM